MTAFGSIAPSWPRASKIGSSMLRASRWIVGRGGPKPTGSISSCSSECSWRWSGARHGFAGVVRVPTPTEEDAKRQHRERQVLVADRTAHSNRIKGILMTLGIRDANPRRRDFTEHLETLRAATGDPLPPHTKQALIREHQRLCLLERQIKEIEVAQAVALKATQVGRPEGREEGRGGARHRCCSSRCTHPPEGHRSDRSGNVDPRSLLPTL